MPGLFLGAGNIASEENRHVPVLEGLVLQQEVTFKERPLRSLNSNSWSYIGIGLRTAGFVPERQGEECGWDVQGQREAGRLSLKASWAEGTSSTPLVWQKSGKNGILFMKLSL